MALLLLLSRTSRFWTIICVGNQFEYNGPSWWEPIPPAVKAHSLTAHCTGVLRYLKSQRLNISSQNIRGRIPVLEVTSECWDQVINQYDGEVISRKINKPLSDLDHDDCWAVTYRCYTAHLQACVSMEGKRLNKYDLCNFDSSTDLLWSIKYRMLFSKLLTPRSPTVDCVEILLHHQIHNWSNYCLLVFIPVIEHYTDTCWRRMCYLSVTTSSHQLCWYYILAAPSE